METSFFRCVEEMRLYSNEYKVLKEAKFTALTEGNFSECSEKAELQGIIFDEMMKLYATACSIMSRRFLAGEITYEQRKVMKSSIEAFYLD